VYQGGKDVALPAMLATRITDAKTQTAFEQRTPLFADRSSTTRSADYLLDLPLADLGSGQYLLTIEATCGGKETPRRDVRFSVR
jgi:hypothetical protein